MPPWSALAAALITVTLWASAFVGIRSAGHDLAPGSLSLARLLVGSLVLSLVVLVKRPAMPGRRDLLPIAACGALWFGAYNVVLNAAERRVDAGTAAMLVNVGPILIAVLAGIALHEGFPRTLVAGCAVAFTGVLVIGVATSQHGVDAGPGALMCLAAAVAYSCAVVIQKPVLSRVPALTVTWLACLVGTVVCLPFSPQLVREAGSAGHGSLAWAVYLGALPTALAFTTWAYALARTPAGRLGATTYLVPPIAIVLGWLLLGETPPALAVIGGVICLAGVAISRRRPSAQVAPVTTPSRLAAEPACNAVSASSAVE
jgi:drug/metabolite transporter (DMT)-like permease